MNNDLFKKVYRYDEDKSQFLLEMGLNNFDELFHEWDASAIRRKDLDPNLVEFLVEAVTELPNKENIGILFKLEFPESKPELEEIAKTVFSNYFQYRLFINHRQIQRLFRRVLLYLIMGFSFIYLAYQLDGLSVNLSFTVFSEGLFIGGWVFIWESISLLFFRIRSMGREKKRFTKILEAPIYFQYKNVKADN